MQNYSFNETSYENALIELFQKTLGYDYVCGYDLERDFKQPLLLDNVFSALSRINKSLPRAAIDEAILKLKSFDSRDTVLNNKRFTDYMQNGVEVSYVEKGQQKGNIVRLIDFDNVDNNEFLIVNQYTVDELAVKRPDLVVFVNGFPLVDVELKSCSREETDSSEAYRQIRNRILDIPSFYNYNAFCVISDMTNTKAGTITATEDRYMEWKTIDGGYEETRFATFQTFFEGIFDKRRFLDILQNFVMFSGSGEKTFKVMSAYHQFYAVKKAVGSTFKAIETDGKAGVVWHTQGSGKSFSMVFYAKLLTKLKNNTTIVVLTDRNDLDNQLYETFSLAKDYLRQTPVQAQDRADLKNKLKDRLAGGIIFTTMQKFEESDETLSDRSDIVLIADEAHRSQYGLDEKTDPKTGKIVQGYARLVRNSLPNAAFIGFTGTPINDKDRSTLEVFGNYIDVYDITQSVEDNATKPIYYESRVMKLTLDEAKLKEIDEEYLRLSERADSIHIEKSKKELARLDEILGSEKTISALCKDILVHYEDRKNLLTGKAMLVAYSRPIAIKIFKEILIQAPDYKNKVKVVVTGSNDDPEEWKSIIGTDARKKELAKEFKDDNSDFKIAIVVDMWLTGFDVPSLATMYVYKPMRDHNLMQAIARVNRVFKDKEGGLIVDYIGIASNLKHAMKQYTNRDQKNYGDNDISKKALPLFMEKLSICRDFLHGLDYSLFFSGSDLDRANLITQGINHIVVNEQKKNGFCREALALHQAQTLCLSLLDFRTRLEASFIEAVRISITRISQPQKLSLKEINESISALLRHTIKDSDVINIFDDGLDFSIFDKKYIDSLAKLKERNLAVEILTKLLKDEIKMYERTNLVKSELFSEKFKRIMNAYINGQISNAEVWEELRKLAEEINADDAESQALGLSKEEKAFYDALLKPQAIKDYYQSKNESLITIVRELTDMLNKNRTIDWQKKETARSEMRSLVKRLLKRYKYPPDEIPAATDYVIAQCEHWADNLEEFK